MANLLDETTGPINEAGRDIHVIDRPAMAFKLMDDNPSEILVIDGIVRAKSCSIVVENDGLVLMMRIVCAEIINQCRKFSFELDIERF